MKTKFLSILAICTLAISCKNEVQKAENEATVDAPNVENKMTIQMEVIQKTDENYAIYYTENDGINFSDEKTIWCEVKKSDDFQTLNFFFPEVAYPTHVRFDFGIKPEREDIVLKSFKFIYGAKSFEAKGSDFFTYFQPNEGIKTEIDQANSTIKFLKEPGSTVTPFFYPNDKLVEDMARIMQ